MPELPEVEVVKRGLSRLLIKRVVASCSSDNSKSFPNSKQDIDNFLIGAEIISVKRRGKVIIIGLSSQYSLVIHLKMTGQLIFRGEEKFGAGHPTGSLIGQLPDKSTRVELNFKDGSMLFFNDQRKFGWVKLIPTEGVAELPFLQKMGPEPLEGSLSPAVFIERIRRHDRTTVKAAILNQTVLAGVGNIYADESLWLARIHPASKVASLSDKELASLLAEIKIVLQLGVDSGGSTDRNYVDAEGKRGNYLNFANVFRQEGKMCPRHPDVEIVKIRVASRGTHICPVCQVKR